MKTQRRVPQGANVKSSKMCVSDIENIKEGERERYRQKTMM
jgi:hypothetical protein